jgi:hypothetical protein
MATLEGMELPDSRQGDFAHADLLGTLDRRVRALVDRHREASATVRDLRMRLAERDVEIAELRQRVAVLCDVRDRALDRVSSILARIGQDGGEATTPVSSSAER